MNIKIIFTRKLSTFEKGINSGINFFRKHPKKIIFGGYILLCTGTYLFMLRSLYSIEKNRDISVALTFLEKQKLAFFVGYNAPFLIYETLQEFTFKSLFVIYNFPIMFLFLFDEKNFDVNKFINYVS